MCGLSGIGRIGSMSLRVSDHPLLRSLSRAVAHRGPDETEILEEDNVGMAFTRLSLVAPGLGSQPLTSDDGRFVLMANGEVYNHLELTAGLKTRPRYRTKSDCEVLLYLYRERGLQFLDDVIGMISVVIWDRRERKLVFAKDRFGIKPLFLHQNADRILFASEIKALFSDPATPREFDWASALDHPGIAAAARTNDAEITTFFRDIESIPAASIMTVDLDTGSRSAHRYWSIPGPGDPGSMGAEDAVDEYQHLLVDSVRRCSTADSELGIFLSGGLDSAAVLSMAVDVAPGIQSFTALNASTRLNGDAASAAAIARRLGSPNHQVIFPASAVPTAEEWRQIVWLSETPMCGPEVYYKWQLHRYARQARPELRGMLLGAAADEFTAGYSHDISGGQDWEAFGRNTSQLTRRGRTHPSREFWWGEESARFLQDAALGMDREVDDSYQDYINWEYRKVQQYNVWHEDRTAAGSGIEARVPFLDHRLVELTSRIPRDLRSSLLWDKTILRRAAIPFLPEEVLSRPKGPFYYGSGVHHTYRTFLRMLSRGDGALIEEALAAPGADQMLNEPMLREAVQELSSRPTSSAQVEIVLRLVNMGLLSAMAKDVPAPVIDASPVQLMSRLDEGNDLVDIEGQLGGDFALLPTTPLALTAEAMLLATPQSDAWFLSVDGAIEYELECGTPVLALLQALQDSPGMAFSEACTRVGCELGEVAEEVQQLVSDGALSLSVAQSHAALVHGPEVR